MLPVMIESTLPNEQVIQVRFLLLAFVVVPLVEMLLLFEVSDHIGGLSTVLLVVLTAVIGIQILKQQGFSTLLRANERLASGELPAQEIIEGMMLAAAGVGFMSFAVLGAASSVAWLWVAVLIAALAVGLSSLSCCSEEGL